MRIEQNTVSSGIKNIRESSLVWGHGTGQIFECLLYTGTLQTYLILL